MPPMKLRSGIGYPLTSSYLQSSRFLAAMFMPSEVKFAQTTPHGAWNAFPFFVDFNN